MKKRSRGSRSIAFGAALLLAAAAMGLGISRTKTRDFIWRSKSTFSYPPGIEIGTGNGTAWFGEPYRPKGGNDTHEPGFQVRDPEAWGGYGPARADSPWEWWTWSWRTEIHLSTRPPSFVTQTFFPAWIVPAAVAMPGLWLLALGVRRRRRVQRGGCVKCGYSLAGLADGSVCPECGKGCANAKAG